MFYFDLDTQEAERKVRGRVELLQKRRGRLELVVIVGRGTHSEDGVSRLQPAIMSLLEESQGWASTISENVFQMMCRVTYSVVHI